MALENLLQHLYYNTSFKKFVAGLTIVLGVFNLGLQETHGQVEVAAWGNINGIRKEGQLLEFESSLRVVGPGWQPVTSTGKERQVPMYARKGTTQLVTTRIDSLYFTQQVEDLGAGPAKVNVQFTSKADTNLQGVYFCVALPAAYYSEGTMQVIGTSGEIPLAKVTTESQAKELKVPIKGLKFVSKLRQLEILFIEPTLVHLRKERDRNGSFFQLYVPIHEGNLKLGQTGQKSLSIKASGEVDKAPLRLTINPAKTGRPFAGIGGNFRLQNPVTDPQVIDYSLENLRVAWGRVEMPWRFWQPEINTNPIELAKAGKLDQRVQKAMEMAQRLHKKGMPVILSAWSGPNWAVEGEPRFSPGPDGVWGNPLNKRNTQAIYKSIADYIVYLRDSYGVEVSMFSFNESDLGINIRQTGEEHRDLIKGLGAYFVSRGLKTKMLLGDNSDATTYQFLNPSLQDAQAHKYIGAISFHSWRGWEKETLEKWDSAATVLNVPLIVGEGSIDAAAWRYPAIFEEPTYALEEINLYTRLLAICEPLTILQWQLTADYSPMVGGGIFGNKGPLLPTQRLWNLKQLGSTPQGLQAMPITGKSPDVSSAALGDNTKGVYALHFVNNGATREVALSGLPKKVKQLRIYVTDKERKMQQGQQVKVANGQAKFTLHTQSFTTLTSE